MKQQGLGVYRVWQFVRGLTAPVTLRDRALVERLLTSPQLSLFLSMSSRDQRHGLDLVCAPQGQGYQAPELLRAALLHDVGKAEHIGLPYRVAAVLLERFAPELLQRLAEDRPVSLGYPFFAHLNHARWGAERAVEAGSDWLSVELIRRHHEPLLSSAESETDRLLAALQAADGQV